MLLDNGYKLKVLNLVERGYSDMYNPFSYIQNADDILKLVTNIMKNTNGPNATEKSNADPFWEKAEMALLEAIFGYLVFVVQPEDRNMEAVMKLLGLAETGEGDSVLDAIFKDLEEEEPTHFAVKQYKIFKLAAKETAMSILVSVGVRLAPFNIESIARIFSQDTLELGRIGDEKTALFIITADTDTSFSFIAAMVFQQLFDTLVRKADAMQGGKLPIPVVCLFDEFANCGQIPGFPVLISTIRSRNISAVICLQGLSQLKANYESSWEIIAGNCDSLLFLGGMEQTTIKYISEMCGKQTVKSKSMSEQKGSSGSSSTSVQFVGRELITESEIATLGDRDCILKIARVSPFLSKKFPLEKHPNYKFLSDCDQRQWLSYRDAYKLAGNYRRFA